MTADKSSWEVRQEALNTLAVMGFTEDGKRDRRGDYGPSARR